MSEDTTPKDDAGYREGDQPDAPQETAPEISDDYEDKQEVIPHTAFLVVKLPGKIDIVTELPGMKMQHEATPSDVRDMSRIVYDDMMIKLTSSRAAQVMTEGLTKAAQMQAMRQQMGNVIQSVKR